MTFYEDKEMRRKRKILYLVPTKIVSLLPNEIQITFPTFIVLFDPRIKPIRYSNSWYFLNQLIALLPFNPEL